MELQGIEAITTFVLAGNARFTVENTETGNRHTYRVKKADPRPGEESSSLWFVSVLTGSCNESDYTYAGIFTRRGERLSYRSTRKSRISDNAPSVRGILFLVDWVNGTKTMPAQMRVLHEGRCGRCGRTLTVPASIETGLGPECAGRVGA